MVWFLEVNFKIGFVMVQRCKTSPNPTLLLNKTRPKWGTFEGVYGVAQTDRGSWTGVKLMLIILSVMGIERDSGKVLGIQGRSGKGFREV